MGRLLDCLDSMEAGIGRTAERVPALPETEVVLMRLLLMGGSVVADEFERALKPHGLNESDFRTLVVLFSSPQGRAHPGELCQFATQTPTNMTRIADGLVRRGLITRSPSDEDRRRIVLQITPAGQRFVRKLLPLLVPRVRQLFAGFSAADKRHLNRLLHKVVRNLDAMVPQPADPA
jgi:MarR family transcriptional repressor of emrRAB